jgi:hypothetical protein
MNYIICPYRLVSSEIWYTNPDGLAPEEVFFDVIREDFLINNQTIVFGDKHLKHVYSHIHINKPADGIALLKIANRLVEEDEQQVWDKFPGEDRQFATLFIVSRKDASCFYIEENEKAFASMEDYINMVCRGFNAILSLKGLAVVPDKHIVRQNDNYGMMYMSAVINNHLKATYGADSEESALSKFDEKMQQATRLFTSSLVDMYKASLVIQTLYLLTQNQMGIKRKLCVLKAALDTSVLVRPGYKDYIEVFECGNELTKYNYSRCTNPKAHKYENDPLYKNAYREFMKIKELDL